MTREHILYKDRTLHSRVDVQVVFLLLGFCTVVCEATFASESFILFRELVMRSASTPSNSFAADSMGFSDVNGDGIQEFIFHEYTQNYPKDVLLKLAHVNAEELEIVWTAPRELRTGYGRFLVGNVDGDPESELVVFSGRRMIRETLFGTRVFNWRGDELITVGTDQLPAEAGALVDIDGDDVHEIAFAVVPEQFENWEGTEPAILMICRVTPNGFKTLYQLELPHAVTSLNSGDLNGDGIDEFFTEEISHDGSVEGQIAIYEVDARNGIRRVFAQNRLVSLLRFFRTFQSQGSTYLLIVNSSINRPFTIYKPKKIANGSYELEPQHSHNPQLLHDAVLSTMAYSPATKHYLRTRSCSAKEEADAGLRRCDKLEWIPEENLQ
ncbi:MAG: hypothetical protein OXC80_08270 [Gammaproteobacteria bacterium]|nr:hypothetical protein [Gammaproteobacteria bacterium]